MKVLISGAGIAGPTLAYWLTHYGIETTIAEIAPQLRRGGYIVDFWGAGYDIANRMGLLPEIIREGYRVREVRIVDRNGKRAAGFAAHVFVQSTGGRFVSLPRGELAAAIFGQVERSVKTIFGDSISHIEQNEGAVDVTFKSGLRREFDLVIGADGLHSRVGELVFGAESQFESYLGYKAAAFEVAGYRPRGELVYVMYPQVRQQAGRFAMRGEGPMFLFLFADENSTLPSDIQIQKAVLRERFVNAGWECAQILEALDGARELYLSQICIDPDRGLWTRGRVSLIGDAASCISFLGGQGSALSMIAAYILAGELSRCGSDYAQAFSTYQNSFGPFVRKKQRAALRIAGFFIPQVEICNSRAQSRRESAEISGDCQFRRGKRSHRQTGSSRIPLESPTGSRSDSDKSRRAGSIKTRRHGMKRRIHSRANRFLEREVSLK
jgi:2-polyprenyl-6-methoxyphenol hydroxylase-like FAD-dependent oxidoreductase